MTQIILVFALILCILAPVHLFAQEELGDISGPSSSWTLISVYRTWTPQSNNFPNGGFGFQSFFNLNSNRRWWFGLAFCGTGVERRDVLSLQFGPGVYIVGDSRLGAFAYVQTGIALGSDRGVAGFDVFSNPTSTWGLATIGGVGGTAKLSTLLKVHLAAVGSWYTMEKGRTPFGLQFGISFGGK
mgnify:CR=1 FL=1